MEIQLFLFVDVVEKFQLGKKSKVKKNHIQILNTKTEPKRQSVKCALNKRKHLSTLLSA